MMSAGSRSGVNWMRWNCAWMAAASVRTDKVLARPGHAFQQHVAVGQQADQQPVHQMFLADDDLADFLAQLWRPRPRPVALLHLIHSMWQTFRRAI